MHGPMRLAPTPGLPPRLLLLFVVLLASPLTLANSLKKLADSFGDDMERYALLMLDPAGRAAAAADAPSVALPRRITAKSVFIAPSARPRCDEGYERDASGACVRRINVDPDNAWSFFVGKLNDKFGALDPAPQSAAEAAAEAEAVEAVAVATQVAAEAAAEPAPHNEEPLHFHIPIESVPEVTTDPPTTETTTLPTTTESIQDETATVPPPTPPVTTPAFEPEVILVDDRGPPLSLSLSMAPVVVQEFETASEPSTTLAPSTRPAATRPTVTRSPPTRPPPTSYAVKSDDVDADPMINSVSDSPLLAGLKKFAPIVVAELPPNYPSPSPSGAGVSAAEPLDASAVPPRRRPSSSFIRFPETTSTLSASSTSPASSSKPFVFPREDADRDPPRQGLFPGLSRNAGRRFSLGRTH